MLLCMAKLQCFVYGERALLKINGIGKVEIMGAGEYAMRVWLRPDLLAYYNISVSDILSAISTEAGIYPAGITGDRYIRF